MFWRNSDKSPLTGRRMQLGYEKSSFSTNISLYIGKIMAIVAVERQYELVCHCWTSFTNRKSRMVWISCKDF